MAGGGVALIGITLIPLLSGLLSTTSVSYTHLFLFAILERSNT